MGSKNRKRRQRGKPGSKNPSGAVPTPNPGGSPNATQPRRSWSKILLRSVAVFGSIAGTVATYTSIRAQMAITVAGGLPDSPDEPAFIVQNTGVTAAFDVQFDCAIQGSYRAQENDLLNISLASAEESYPSGNMAPVERLASEAQVTKFCAKRFHLGPTFEPHARRAIFYVVHYRDFLRISHTTIAKFGNSVDGENRTSWVPMEVSNDEREEILSAEMPSGRAEVCKSDCGLVPIIMIDENGAASVVSPD